MDVIALQKEIESLPGHLQDRLAAFLTVLRLHRSGEDQEILNRLDDKQPDKWLSWKDLRTEMDGDHGGK